MILQEEFYEQFIVAMFPLDGGSESESDSSHSDSETDEE